MKDPTPGSFRILPGRSKIQAGYVFLQLGYPKYAKWFLKKIATCAGGLKQLV